MRLFVTVGTQFPFDRLVRVVDQWLGEHPGVEAFGQLGPAVYQPRHMNWESFIPADECRRQVEAATAVIAHAGMGSIITALEMGKPIIVMPRNAALDEHRNDHQLATARSMLARGRVIVALDEGHLLEKLNHIENLAGNRGELNGASPQLLSALRRFALTGDRTSARARVSPQPVWAASAPLRNELAAIPSPVLAEG